MAVKWKGGRLPAQSPYLPMISPFTNGKIDN